MGAWPLHMGRQWMRAVFMSRRARGLTVLAVLASLAPAASALADTILVSNEKGNSITVLDGASLKVIKTVPVGQRPRGTVRSKDGNFLYICASDDEGT